eukprot:11202252-Lingulodinium_polyedra.AAC.1
MAAFPLRTRMRRVAPNTCCARSRSSCEGPKTINRGHAMRYMEPRWPLLARRSARTRRTSATPTVREVSHNNRDLPVGGACNILRGPRFEKL